MKFLLFVFLQAYAIGTCWTKINGELVVETVPLWPLPIVAAAIEPGPNQQAPLPNLAAPTDFQAQFTKNGWVILSWHTTPGIEEFEVLAQTEGVLTIHHVYDHKAKEVKPGEYQWKTKFPGKLTIYSVRSVVTDITSLPSNEIRCVP